MAVDQVHPEYAANIGSWRKCRAVHDGEDAVRAGGRAFLPQSDPKQSWEDYEAYSSRAIFNGSFARTVAGCVGAVGRRDHTFDLPTSLAGFDSDATASGMSLAEVVRLLAAETLITGRAGILVDYDETQRRSFLSVYPAESIINWGGDFGIVLHEMVYLPDPTDPFKLRTITQYRQLHMVDGAYTVTLWRKSDGALGGDAWLVYDQLVPLIRGTPLDRLPWTWLSYVGRTASIFAPPLLALADASLAYWRQSADLQHGRHFCGIPTLYITGAEDDGPVRVGATAAILLKDPAARVGYAEFTGQGLGSLERGLAEVTAQMALLGAATFGSSRGAETAEAARIRAGSHTSVLAAVVVAVEEALLASVQMAARWMSAYGDVRIALNREFHDAGLDPQMLGGMVAALQAGAVTPETFTHMLDQAALLPPEAAVAA